MNFLHPSCALVPGRPLNTRSGQLSAPTGSGFPGAMCSARTFSLHQLATSSPCAHYTFVLKRACIWSWSRKIRYEVEIRHFYVTIRATRLVACFPGLDVSIMPGHGNMDCQPSYHILKLLDFYGDLPHITPDLWIGVYQGYLIHLAAKASDVSIFGNVAAGAVHACPRRGAAPRNWG